MKIFYFYFTIFADGEDSEEDTLKFELKVKCTKKPNAAKDVPVPNDLALNNHKGIFYIYIKLDGCFEGSAA